MWSVVPTEMRSREMRTEITTGIGNVEIIDDNAKALSAKYWG